MSRSTGSTASSANLGPGFDSFAIALPLLAEFDLRPARTWSVNIDSDGHEDGAENGIPTGDDNLFVVSARAAAEAASETLGSYHVTQRSAIPVGRGLGSSAAAIVGGVVAANALMGEPLDRRSDLFSVGAVLFECITGRKMWGGGTDLEIIRKLALEAPAGTR